MEYYNQYTLRYKEGEKQTVEYISTKDNYQGGKLINIDITQPKEETENPERV